ncbi:MAG: alpha/beta hydrolase [Actinomycetota bacterium]|nr:alpha/beta hydrolase [Actinomycetota bacterium]
MTRVASRLTVTGFDGTSLAGYHFDGGTLEPLVLVNAIGPDLSAWRYVIDEVEPERPVVAWDLRGLHGSGKPASQRVDAAAHCEDAIAVLDATGAQRFVLAAWSTGTRIAVELARTYPERVKALAIVCGGAGRGFRGLFRYLETSPLFPYGAGLAKHFAGSLQGAFRAFVSRPEIAGVVRQSGVIGPTADVDGLVAVLQSFAACDLRQLLTIYEEVAGDSDPSVFAEVQAPCLVVSGRRDRFATQGMVDEMLTRLPLAEKVVYQKGSHFIPLEYPERLALDMAAHFRP